MADLTINAQPRTIRLKEYGVRHERPVSVSAPGNQQLLGAATPVGSIIPGALLSFASDGSFNVQTVPDKKCATVFALENELIGLGIDDVYKQGDYIQAEHFDSGDWVLAYVAPAAAAISIGTLLVSDATGGLKALGADDASEAIAVSMDAINNSGGTSIARLRVAML
jgi:hypothetical protein